jgi:curved DNA-binding protein CbpA
MAQEEKYYRVLGVSRDASTLEIRRAYRRLARQHHPDRNSEPDGSERFRRLAEAYAVLNDPARRGRCEQPLRPTGRRDAPRATPATPTRLGVLELSAREAQFAATTPLTLTTSNGLVIVLPAGIADGDQAAFTVPEGRAVLTIRVNFRTKDLIRDE